MKLWIRVDANVARDPSVASFADTLGISKPMALGHLVMVWGVMAEHTPHGFLSAVGVKTLEDWAGWRGKRGAFHAAFVEYFVTDDRVNGWAERQGKLIEMAAKDRARKGTGNSTEIPRKEHGNSAVTGQDGTEQYAQQQQQEQPAPDGAFSVALVESSRTEPSTALVVMRDDTPRRTVSAIQERIALVLGEVAAGVRRRMSNDEQRRMQAELVFAYWATKLNHPQTLLDPQREAKLVAALKQNGGNVSELLYAVDGILRSPFHMGKNDTGEKHDGITSMFGKRERIEAHAARCPAYLRGDPHPVAAQLGAPEAA